MLAKRLKQARLAKKLTQEQLANKVNTKKTTISNYENEHSTPSNEMLRDLADVLEVTSDYLLGRTDSPEGFMVDYSKANNPDGTFDSLAEINKLVKKYGIEQMGFFDIEEWKSLSPHDVKMIEEHFKMIVRLAKERNEEEE